MSIETSNSWIYSLCPIKFEFEGRGINLNFEGFILCGSKDFELFKKTKMRKKTFKKIHGIPNNKKCLEIKTLRDNFLIGFSERSKFHFNLFLLYLFFLKKSFSYYF